MSNENDDQRSFYRMTVDCQVEFSEQASSDKYTGEGKNLSATGVNFITDHQLEVGQELDVIVHPVIKTVVPLSAKARVVRVEKDEQSNQYIVGISLAEVR